MSKWLKWKTWNDQLSLAVIIGLPVLWAFKSLPPEVLGATLVGWTLTLQFYFRRAGSDASSDGKGDTTT